MSLVNEDFNLVNVKLKYKHTGCTFGTNDNDINDVVVKLMFSSPIKNHEYMLTYEDVYPITSKKYIKKIISMIESNPFTISINQFVLESKHLKIGFIESTKNSPMFTAQSLGIWNYNESTINGVDFISFISTLESYTKFKAFLMNNGLVSNILIKEERNVFLHPKNQLSNRQEEVIRRAFYNGFFNNPKTIHLKDMSKDLGISIATLNEYIRIAEKKILTSYFEELI